MPRHILPLLLIIILATTLPAMDISINKSIIIDDGKRNSGGMTTINGNLSIGNDCIVTGTCRTVNGSIDVGDNTTVKKLQSVNGGITLGHNSRVLANVETVNGYVTCNSGVEIQGNIKTINAVVELDNTCVKRNINTHTGNIYLQNGSMVEKNLVVRASHHNENSNDENKPVKIVLSQGSVIKGDLLVKDKDRKVLVYLQDDSKILGKVKNAQIINE